MPFNTLTPNSAMNPIPAEILKGIPAIHNANTPPIADKGIAEKTKTHWVIFPKVKNSRININANATGTAILNLLLASSRF